MAGDNSAGGAFRKRQQIENSSRTMFVWVALASALVGVALVVSYFLVQQIWFQQKVLGEKNKTLSVLRSSNSNVEELRNNIRLLSTNSALGSIKARSEDSALQVVLDALPADENVLALGASVQKNLIESVPNVNLESISYNNSSTARDEGSSTNTDTDVKEIGFTVVVSSTDANALKEVLTNFEKSIRVIDIDNMVVEMSSNRITLTLSAHAYYSPEKRIELTDRVVKP